MFPAEPPPLPQNRQIPLYFLIFLTLPFIFPLFFILISRFFCSKKSVENSGPRSGRLQEAEIKNPAPSPVEEHIPVSSSSSSQSVVSPTNKNNKNGETFHDNLDLVEEEVDICVVETRQTVPQREVTGGGN